MTMVNNIEKSIGGIKKKQFVAKQDYRKWARID